MLPNLVFIPGFFLWHLRIPEAIIGWGCHPLCITMLPNLVFIPGFFLWHLCIPEAILGWGCHPLCG
jgi:hypothetical protein